MIGLATYGDDDDATMWLKEFRFNRFRDNDIPLLNRIAAGGGWPEGAVYDGIANISRMKSAAAWQLATGEDLFVSTSWYEERLGYFLLHSYPGTAQEYRIKYRPYLSNGDGERNRGSMAQYERIMALILLSRFGENEYAEQLQAYLAAPSVNQPSNYLIHDEFLWFNPDQAKKEPELLSHYAEALGSVRMRSGWPSGADDTDTSATYITFQCGDRFAYHQHHDQNSFTLFKHDDLLVDSGIYSGNGLSAHDTNYYARTIAHNTLVVYNPEEDFTAIRPYAVANDGGQRSPAPSTRAPQTVEFLDINFKDYDTGDILHYADNPWFTYTLGDATKAYNNPDYNQAQYGMLLGNTAKVSRFQREFVYLRPFESASKEYLVIFDRVGVTKSEFSGENTKLLLHLMSEPEVDGDETWVSPGETLFKGAHTANAISGDKGKVFVKTLLPENHNIRKVGGKEKSFWVFGKNYNYHWSEGDETTTGYDPVPYGEWRLEIEPADYGLDHNFLTVIHPTEQGVSQMPETILIEGATIQGAHILDPSLNRVVLFSSDLNGAAPQGILNYSVKPTTQTMHVIFDLIPGDRYSLSTTQNGASWDISLSPNAGGEYQVGEGGELRFMLD